MRERLPPPPFLAPACLSSYTRLVSPPSPPPRHAPPGGSSNWRLVSSRRREVEGEGINGVGRSPDQRSRGGSFAVDVVPVRRPASKSLPGALPLLSARRRIGWIPAVRRLSNDRASEPSRPTSGAPDPLRVFDQVSEHSLPIPL